MTREHAEQAIFAKMQEIAEISREYNPNGNYLALVVYPQTNYISFNNSYWNADAELPIDFTDGGKEWE